MDGLHVSDSDSSRIRLNSGVTELLYLARLPQLTFFVAFLPAFVSPFLPAVSSFSVWLLHAVK